MRTLAVPALILVSLTTTNVGQAQTGTQAAQQSQNTPDLSALERTAADLLRQGLIKQAEEVSGYIFRRRSEAEHLRESQLRNHQLEIQTRELEAEERIVAELRKQGDSKQADALAAQILQYRPLETLTAVVPR